MIHPRPLGSVAHQAKDSRGTEDQEQMRASGLRATMAEPAKQTQVRGHQQRARHDRAKGKEVKAGSGASDPD